MPLVNSEMYWASHLYRNVHIVHHLLTTRREKLLLICCRHLDKLMGCGLIPFSFQILCAPSFYQMFAELMWPQLLCFWMYISISCLKTLPSRSPRMPSKNCMQFLNPEIWSLSGDPEAIVHNIGRIDSDGGAGMPGLWNLGEPRLGTSWCWTDTRCQ